MSKRLLLCGLALLLLALALAACTIPAAPAGDTGDPAATGEPATKATRESPLLVLIDNDEGPITPVNFNTFIGFWMIGWVYDPLFVRAPDLNPIPALATSAEPSADGMTWKITLREGVRWHDGEPLTAADVVFSYRFLIDAGRAQALNVIDSITANGDLGVTITLKSPSPFFLSEGLAGYYIMPEHIWRDQEPISGELNQFQGRIGTGPFKLSAVTPGESYTFEANPDYFRGKPLVERIIAKIVKDRTQQFNQLRTGAASAVLSSVPPALVEDMASSPDIALAQGSDFFNYVFYANKSRPPFDDVRVRKAIAQSIDADALVKTVLLGQGTVLPASYYHPDLPWAEKIAGAYDPGAAAALLDEAGLKDSDGDGVREFAGQPTAYEILCDVNNAVEVRATELIVGWLKGVGIGVEPRCMDIDTEVTFIWPSFTAVPNPDYDMAIWGWSSGPQFQRGFLRFMVHHDLNAVGWANLTGGSDLELDALLDEYVSTPDPARQGKLNQLIQKRFADTLPFIPVMSPGGNFAYRPADYDGWVYVSGTGIMTAWSFLPPEAAAP